MDQQQWKKVNQIVDTALDLKQNERLTYIEQACEGDQQLKENVTELLRSIEQSSTEDFLQGTEAYPYELAADFSKQKQSSESALIGETIGNYKILKLIGHGGMGSVFLTERTDDAYDKNVALKLLRHGMDTPSNIARFQRERNILANLDHPNIARLLDGGVTDDGLPYLVMEYVDGTPLYEYCNDHNLTIEDRLNLFQSIGRAVQHAHKNAIIHRDLKPSNILVTDNGKVKILDFGIAKMIDTDAQENDLFQTRTGARMLTLGYAAPEQVENEPITTATDVYTLGILLYELLVGTHPFRLDRKNLSEIEDVIRNKVPTKPSEKFLSLSPDDNKQIAKFRDASTSELPQILSGDLDAIVMKALRKESEKRYDSAENFLVDLQRHKQNLPIIAREDTWRYNTSKFIKRHKTGLAITAGFVLIVISFTAFYTWQIAKERNRVQREAEKAQQVSDFLTDLFRASNPYYNPEDTVTAASLLQRGEERIKQLDDQPVVQTQLLSVIGKANSELGRYETADRLMQRSLVQRKKLFGGTSIKYAKGLKNYASLYRKMGNFNKAESLSQEALTILKSLEKPKPHQLAGTINGLALILQMKGNYKTADSLYAQALQIYRKDPKSTPRNIANAINNRAGILRQLGKLKEAEVRFRKSLEMWQEIHGDIHPNLVAGFSDLASLIMNQGKFKKADSLFRRSLQINREIYDGPHRNTAQILSNMGLLHGRAGNYQRAENYMLEALNMRCTLFRAKHPSLAESLNNLGRLYIKKGEYEKARPLLNEALTIDKKIYEPTHPYIAVDLGNLGRIEKNTGSLDEAESFYKQSLAIFQKKLPPNHARIGATLTELGEVLYLQEELAPAEDTLRKALEIRQDSFDKGDWRIADSKVTLGACLIRLEKYQESEKLLKNGYQTLLEKRGASSRRTQQARLSLAKLYREWQKPNIAKQYDSS